MTILIAGIQLQGGRDVTAALVVAVLLFPVFAIRFLYLMNWTYRLCFEYYDLLKPLEEETSASKG